MLEMLSASLKVSVPPCKTELNRKWQFMLLGVSVGIADEDSSDKQVDKLFSKMQECSAYSEHQQGQLSAASAWLTFQSSHC